MIRDLKSGLNLDNSESNGLNINNIIHIFEQKISYESYLCVWSQNKFILKSMIILILVMLSI